VNKEAYNHFDAPKEVSHYNDIYGKTNFSVTYPANKKRLEIFLSIIDEIKPSTIVDAGCGNGAPLVEILKKGFSAKGYDKSDNMLTAARDKLTENKFNTNLVSKGDFENPKHLENESVDCITGMGTFYYSKDFNRTLVNQVKKLKYGGSIIFSLRNRLFDLVTNNQYTYRLLYELFDMDNKENSIISEFNRITKFHENEQSKKFNSIDESNVFSSVHNPLDIDILLENVGLYKKSIYFYHYHALPPTFEHTNPEYFRKMSWGLENPKDWRGHFLASNFVVHAEKK
jgi:SAM-dependent methyltransferase